ncbi:MAG: hypothetical protein RR533_09205, partial [Carnobacterium sp.]
GEQWNIYFKEKYGPGNVERKIYFKDTGALESHFNKHNGEMKKAMGLSNYSLETYLNDANYVINNGTYVPEMNGYVKL